MWVWFNEGRVFAHGSNIKGFLLNATSFNISKVLDHNHVVLGYVLLFYFISECGSPQHIWFPSLAENNNTDDLQWVLVMQLWIWDILSSSGQLSWFLISLRWLWAARPRESRRQASLVGFVGMSLPRDGAVTPCLTPSVCRSPGGGCGKHHSSRNAFAVKIQSSAVKLENLVRNLQHLPVHAHTHI